MLSNVLTIYPVIVSFVGGTVQERVMLVLVDDNTRTFLGEGRPAANTQNQ